MIKRILVISALLITGLCHAQNVTFKKNVILKNDEPVGKFEGKATLLKGTDVSVVSMEGAPLVLIKDPLVRFGSPFYEPLRYYSVTFVPLNKTVAFIPADKKFFASERKLIEYLYYIIGNNFLTKDGLSTEVIDRFTASNRDQTKVIEQDTLQIKELVKISKDKLKEPVASKGASFKLFAYSKREVNQMWAETIQEFDIIQNEVVIGKISKVHRGDPSVAKESSLPPSQSIRYIVSRKVSPFDLNGKTISYVNVALLSGSAQFPNQYTECENAGLTGFKFSDIYSAEHEMVAWLLSKGCL